MAKRLPDNCEGRFYVDDNCINCSLCAEVAPAIFSTNHDEGYEYVARQPESDGELELVAEMINLCPASAIQDIERAE
ncbi:MAG: ferredoxin [Desulfobacterales bacterium]|nr:ferredoxin [Desulfobacterales bacterium]